MNATAPRVTIRGTDREFYQAPEEASVLQAALRAGVALPYECSSGGCGTCRLKVASGTYESLWPAAPGLSARDRARGFELACQIRATSDLELVATVDSARRRAIVPHRMRAALKGTEPLTADLRRFCFETDSPAEFIPGQYAILESGIGRRAYSMSNLPNADGRWEFIIKRVPGGRFSEALFAGRLDAVVVDGSYGLAHVRDDSSRDVLCVAGGSGLSPMVSIVRSIASDPAQRHKRIDVFYGGRTVPDLCAEAQLLDLPGYGERVVVHSVISDRDHPSTVGWVGALGFVHEHVATAMGTDARNREVYFAGPPPMAEAMQRLLMVDLRVPFEQIHFDRFF